MPRLIKRTRQVPHTVHGTTRMVTETYTLPAPPLDWDRIVLTGVATSALTFVAVSVTWTAASIGDLLSLTVSGVIAYAAAVGFDTSWITCMGLEWLARYDEERAKWPRRAGHVALALAVLAVGVHGYVLDARWAGGIGATVSAMAKALWTLLLRQVTLPLDPLTAEWLRQRRGEIGGELALLGELKRLDRLTAQRAALAASAADTLPLDSADTDRTPDTDAEDTAPARLVMAPGTVRSAILGAATAWPDEDAPDITARLAGLGIPTDTDTVRAVLEDTDEDIRPDADTVVRPIGSPRRGPSDTNVAAEVRAARIAGVKRGEMLGHIRGVLGPKVTSDAVRKAWDRSTDKAAP